MKEKSRAKSLISEYFIFVIFIALVVVLTCLKPSFIQPANLVNILKQASINGILAFGMMFVIIAGGFDMSVGSTVAFTGILAALTGCSSGTETTEESTGGDASAESGDGAYKIALIQQHQTNAFQIGVTEGAQAKADELGVELNILSADQDAAKQISQIEQCVSEGYDAILFEPVDPDGLRDAAKAAADAGVIMINIVSACTDWESAGISAVSCGDNVKAGENEMQHVADLLGGKGNIAILTGPSSTTDTTARLEGYRNILANYPDMTEVIAPADCAWDTAKAQSTVESWLSAYDLDAIVCQNDGMAVGAGNAAGANSGIVITGLDGTPDGYEAIKDGRITGTVAQDGGLMASSGVEAAVTLLDGGTLENNLIIADSVWIDSSNVADYE